MGLERTCLQLASVAALLCPTSAAQTTARMSVDSAGAQADSDSDWAQISSDGRYVAFTSWASNLVPGDTNQSTDVFVHDRQTGVTTRVSVDSSGAQGDLESDLPSISSDGRFVAFRSAATNLVPGDTNGVRDIFVHDLQSGSTTRVSVDSAGVQGNDASYTSSISSNGGQVSFYSAASNLIPGDTNGVTDIFVHDLSSGSTTRVSVDSGGAQADLASVSPSISADGRLVAFRSAATDLVPGDTNGVTDIFVHDVQSGSTTRVSVDSAGAQGNLASHSPSISADGRTVAFYSYASNLVPADTNGMQDVFVRDLTSGATQRVSVDSSGAQGDDWSIQPSISSDGRCVAFRSAATNLVPGDTNNVVDILLHDRLSGATTRVSIDSAGVQGDANCGLYPTISADGSCVVFQSLATNLVSGDTNSRADIFVHDRGAASAFTPFCAGDGSGVPCPCANSGAAGHGCENSAGTGGALLTASGSASLSGDTVQLTSSGELASVTSIVLQGTSAVAPANFGDGLRCAGGSLKRLYLKSAVGGVVTAPLPGDPSISARSAALGDPIDLGATREYQVYYRDPSAGFCPSPAGATFNVSSAIAIAWGA